VFRLMVSSAADLTTIRVVGRLRDDGVVLLANACDDAKRPLVLDLSELTGASDGGVLLLGRLAREGVHLLGASPYIRLLLGPPEEHYEPVTPRSQISSRSPRRRQATARRRPKTRS